MIRNISVRRKSQCMTQCFLEPNCVSYNYGPLYNDVPTCELSNRTHLQVSSSDFIQKEEYIYQHILNPCESSPCPSNTLCQAGFTNKGYRSICPKGLEGGATCYQDVDECIMASHDYSPDADCSNSVGSFQCACRTGYTGDGKTCQDNDECTMNTHDCSSNADCSNVMGSFQCACKSGYTGDGKACQGEKRAARTLQTGKQSDDMNECLIISFTFGRMCNS
ncbi:unnamed protein product [Pocillopora meandrina]|uniref:EGF-like domain-containing protein n=1 Tax=Pocillopora meandrina TaxID=46732 RepID=A0AAU9VVB5_9CNID|nr:unnamed protein product [Pocillopora meandrina]